MWTLALVGALFVQSGPAGFDWGSLLGGAIGSSPVAGVLLWRLLRADKETEALREEIVALHRQTLHTAERMAPILADATRTLDDVKGGLEATLDRGRTRGEDQTEQVMRRLDAALRDIKTQRRRDEP